MTTVVCPIHHILGNASDGEAALVLADHISACMSGATSDVSAFYARQRVKVESELTAAIVEACLREDATLVQGLVVRMRHSLYTFSDGAMNALRNVLNNDVVMGALDELVSQPALGCSCCQGNQRCGSCVKRGCKRGCYLT